MKKVVIQGLGFVGSAMATAVASILENNKFPLFDVIGKDISTKQGLERVKAINNGEFPFPILDKKLKKELKNANSRGNIRATTKTNCFADADIVIVSINCDLIKDFKKNAHRINMKNFSESMDEIAENISENTLLIIESTVPPGTCKKVIFPIFEKKFEKRKLDINKFYLAHSYERVMPGKDYFDSIINYWRVYSGINSVSADKCEEFLSKLINIKDYPLSRMSNTTASETGKVLENSYRAVNIAFIEEWGRFAEQAKIDIFEILSAIRMRPTHSNIRQPGFGVGGYCLTKDPLFGKIGARDILKLKNYDFPFSSQAVKINDEMPIVTLNKLKNHFNNSLKNKKILLLGVTYRNDVGDTRFSPSKIFAEMAIKLGANIICHDPMIDYWEEMNMKIEFNLPSAEDFDVVVFAVPHSEYKLISVQKWMKNCSTLFFDANNVLSNKQINQINEYQINFKSIGRG